MVERLMSHSFVTSDNIKATDMGICLSSMPRVLEHGQLPAGMKAKQKKKE
jgi:hypothetical protein